MNRKLTIASLGLLGVLGVLGLGNVARCVDSDEASEGCSLEEKVEAPKEDSNFENDAQVLNQIDPGYRLTGEELIFLTRMIYFEDGAFVNELRKGFDEGEIQKSNEAIAFVLLNRYELDTKNNSNKFHRKGSNGSLITYAKFNHAFSCLKDRKTYFDSKTFRDEQGRLTLMHEGLNQEYLDVAYNALVRVLSKEVEDPTDEALYYKTKKLGKTGREVWHGTEAFWLNGSCERDWNVDITHHQYYGVNCKVD